MELRNTHLPKFRGWRIVALGTLAFALAAISAFRNHRSNMPIRVTMSGGGRENLRYTLVEALAREARERGIEVHLVDVGSSEDSVEKVNVGGLDFALILGGRDFTRYPNIRQVASLYIAPLHLLVKEEISEAVTHNLRALRGKVVNLGGGRKNLSYWLAYEVLAFADLSPESGGYTATARTLAEIEAEPDRGRMPDAMFMTSTLPTPAIRELVSKYHYRLVPLPFREAFALGALTTEEAEKLPAARQNIVLLKEHIYDAVIPAFTYQIDPGVPPQTIHTLGARVLLVANQKVDSQVVDRLLETIFHTHFIKNLLPLQGFAMRDAMPEIPWHPAALRYFQKDDPLVTSNLLEQLGEIVAIVGPTTGGLFCVWQWFRQRTRFHRERSFEAYISKVTALERRAMDLELNAPFEANLLEDLHNLHRELGKLKAEALGHFSRGEIDGAELITSFLAHINDARTHLTGMIRRLREDAAPKPHDLTGDSPQRHKDTKELTN